MKPLKEIGRTTSVYRLDDPNYRNKFLGLGSLHIYTDDERRELARALIEAWNAKVFGDRNATIPDVEDFLKEQGL